MALPFFNAYRGSIGRFFQGDPTLRGYWQLHNNSQDNSGNGRNGTDSATVYGQSGFRGAFGSVYFNGSADIRIPTLEMSGAGTPLFIGFWVMWKVLPSDFKIFFTIGDGNWGLPACGILYIAINVNNKIEFHLFNTNQSQAVVTDPTPIFQNIWHYYVVGWDGTSSGTNMFVYRNGVLVATGSITYSILASRSGIGTTLGRYYDSSGGSLYYSTNNLCEASVWGRVVAPQEISQYYQWAISQPRKTYYEVGGLLVPNTRRRLLLTR